MGLEGLAMTAAALAVAVFAVAATKAPPEKDDGQPG